MNLEQAVEAAQTAVDTQREKVAKEAAELITAIGPALVQFAKAEMKQIAVQYHDVTSNLKTANGLAAFQAEVKEAIEALPAAVSKILSADDVLVYTFNGGDVALKRFGFTGQEKDLVRAGCNQALSGVQEKVQKKYHLTPNDMYMHRGGNLDFPAPFQNTIAAAFNVYKEARQKLDTNARELEKAKVAVSKAAAQDDFADF